MSVLTDKAKNHLVTESKWRIMCLRVAFGHVCGGITLINLSGKTQFTVGSSIPQEVDPERYKKRETELNTSK